MNITTRPMEPDEARKVQKIGMRAFDGLEGLGVSKPKHAVVALCDDRIVGAVQVKFYRAGGKKIGYIDYAFVDRDFHNRGIGGVLYKAATEYLWERGCDALTALVKDDNVGSWGLFVKNGFSRVSVPDLARQFGFLGMLRLYFGTIYSVAIGMDYYAALPDRPFPSAKGGSAKQLGAYALMNFLLALLLLVGTKENLGAFLAAYGIALGGGVLFGYIGSLFSKRKWRFRLNNGGGLVCALINGIGGVYPMAGNWYPDRYENTAGFRRDMGIQALAGWIYMLILSLLPVVFSPQPILSDLGYIAAIFLLYRVIAIYPFEAFGGARVYRWNKVVFFLMAAISIALFLLNFR